MKFYLIIIVNAVILFSCAQQDLNCDSMSSVDAIVKKEVLRLEKQSKHNLKYEIRDVGNIYQVYIFRSVINNEEKYKGGSYSFKIKKGDCNLFDKRTLK